MNRSAYSMLHHSLTALPRKGMGRTLVVLVMLLSFASQLLLITASLPEESPRAAILRLTGIDIAPSPLPATMQAGTDNTPAEGAEHHPSSRPAPALSPAQAGQPGLPAPSAGARNIPASRTARQPATQDTGHATSLSRPDAMAEDAPCPEHDPHTSQQAASFPASPPSPAASAGEGQQAGHSGGHHDMQRMNTLRDADPASVHTHSHTGYHGGYHHSHHHHGLDCPLCPLLGHVIFALACLAVLLGYALLSRQLWQDAASMQAPPEPAYQRPPSRGPPHFILTNAIA